jgi:UDP-N-acetyl-D-mannosaminuronate dehydrogenase
VCDQVIPVSTLEAAELTKLLENIFRSVNIALVNELAMLTDRMGIDIWEVVDAASTKPYGFMRFEPSVGDIRESPALKILTLPQALGADLHYHDPHVPRSPTTTSRAFLWRRLCRTPTSR